MNPSNLVAFNRGRHGSQFKHRTPLLNHPKVPETQDEIRGKRFKIEFDCSEIKEQLTRMGAIVVENVWEPPIDYFVTNKPNDYEHWQISGPIIDLQTVRPPMYNPTKLKGRMRRLANLFNQPIKRAREECEIAAEMDLPMLVARQLQIVLDTLCPTQLRAEYNTNPHFLVTKNPYIALSDANHNYTTSFKEFSVDFHGDETIPRLYFNSPFLSCPFKNPESQRVKLRRQKQEEMAKLKLPVIHYNGGFCENCQIEYDNIQEHIQKPKHKMRF